MKNRVRQLREEQGLTQKQLGEKVNVSRQAINAVETGKFDPSLWLAYDIAQLFNKSIEEVFDLKKVSGNEMIEKLYGKCCSRCFTQCNNSTKYSLHVC